MNLYTGGTIERAVLALEYWWRNEFKMLGGIDIPAVISKGATTLNSFTRLPNATIASKEH